VSTDFFSGTWLSRDVDSFRSNPHPEQIQALIKTSKKSCTKAKISVDKNPALEDLNWVESTVEHRRC